MGSAEQDQWKEIADGIRQGLAKLVPLIPAMNVEEVSAFITAVDNAMWLEVKAHSHDAAVESHEKVLERESQYGS